MTRFKATVGAIVVLVGFFTATLPGRQGGSEALVQANLQAYMNARTAAFSGITNFSFGVYSDIHMCECGSSTFTRAQWAGLLTTWRDVGNLFGVIVGDLGYGEPRASRQRAVPEQSPCRPRRRCSTPWGIMKTIRSVSDPGSTRFTRAPCNQRAGRHCRTRRRATPTAPIGRSTSARQLTSSSSMAATTHGTGSRPGRGRRLARRN